MTRPRRPRSARGEDLTDLEWRFLNDAVPADEPPSAEHWALKFDQRIFREDRPPVHELWNTYGADVVREWAVERPGMRPSLWWRYSAPEPCRRRVGGIGTSEEDAFSSASCLHYGIPGFWISRWSAAYYNGRATDIHGRLIRAEHACYECFPGDFPHPGVDPANPPKFESEAAFLQRHGLLLPGERKRLHAVDFEPKTISVPDDFYFQWSERA